MKKIEYDIPVYEDEDLADLKEYSEKMAEALKTQVDKFGNPIIFKGIVDNIEALQSITDMQNGYIYMVKSEKKNYIYNGVEWVLYSDNANSSQGGDSLPIRNNSRI